MPLAHSFASDSDSKDSNEQVGVYTDLSYGHSGSQFSSKTIAWTIGALASGSFYTIGAFVGIDGIFPPDKAPETTSYDRLGDTSESRIAAGLFLRFHPIKQIKINHGRTVTPFIGIRLLNQTGGKVGSWEDCTYCSDKYSKYKGDANFYAVAGLTSGPLLVTLEYRLTNNAGFFDEFATDPFGLGPEYDYTKGPYYEPLVIVSLGYQFLVPYLGK